jgi:hypothetical protein
MSACTCGGFRGALVTGGLAENIDGAGRHNLPLTHEQRVRIISNAYCAACVAGWILKRGE